MNRHRNPRIFRFQSQSTSSYYSPASSSRNFNFDRRTEHQHYNNYPNYNTNFCSEFTDPNKEIYFQTTVHEQTNYSDNINPKVDYPPEPIDPKLDFSSDSFDPNFLLNQPYNSIKKILPYPKAKEYNNLAEYHSHVFLKKDNFKKVEKDRLYDRDYAWYYRVLGWDHNIQKRYEQRILRRTKKYAGWLTAKLRKYKPRFKNDPNYEPCRSFPPLQSSKIIQPKSKFRKYKIIPRNISTDSKQSTIENLMNDIPELNITKENTSTKSEPENISS